MPLTEVIEHYYLHGLTVRSALPLDEWQVARLDAAPSAVDVDIRLLPPLHEPMPVSEHISATRYELVVPEVARYVLTDGNLVTVEAQPGAQAAEIRLFLLGSVWGALAVQRDLLYLHVSAVRCGAGAIAFAGCSGAGKSSMAAWLGGTGAALVADDLARFSVENGQACIHPAAPRLKLWQDSIAALDLAAHIVQRDHFRHDKYHLNIASTWESSPVPVRAICLLEWGSPRLERVRGSAALRQLIDMATYRPHLLEPMRRWDIHWQQCLQLLMQVPVYKLSRPRDWSGLAWLRDEVWQLGSGHMEPV